MNEVIDRITAYLSEGGLFNPELANHDTVRDLLIDCRAALASAPAQPVAEPDAAYAALTYKQVLGSKNCMQCCVSYMLGLPLESVPDFATDGGWELFSDFAESQGYAAVMLPGNREFEADYLASGTTARGTSHMVVMNDGKLVHDPHPSNAGLVDVQCVWLLAKRATPRTVQADELEEVLRERDDAEDFINELLDEVLGADRPEWSSAYNRYDAMNDVRERITALHTPAINKAWHQFQEAIGGAQSPTPAQPGQEGERVKLPDPDTSETAPWTGWKVKYHSPDQIIGYGNQQFSAGREFEAARRAARKQGANHD